MDTQASIYLHMIQKWQQIHPEIKLTVKQIISIHHMLNYEPGKSIDPSPFVICHLTESLRKLEREVPEVRKEIVISKFEVEDSESDDEVQVQL